MVVIYMLVSGFISFNDSRFLKLSSSCPYVNWSRGVVISEVIIKLVKLQLGVISKKLDQWFLPANLLFLYASEVGSSWSTVVCN